MHTSALPSPVNQVAPSGESVQLSAVPAVQSVAATVQPDLVQLSSVSPSVQEEPASQSQVMEEVSSVSYADQSASEGLVEGQAPTSTDTGVFI